MNKIILKSLKFKAFRSFSDLQEINNLPSNGLIQIRGRSGAGKSNLHTVLSYIWGYSQYPDTELQSFLTKDKIQTELQYEYNGKLGIIKRGKEEFSFNDIKGSAKLVQNEIQKFLNMPIDLLEPLTVKWQRSGSIFLNMTDSKKKEFLSKLLNLEKLESSIKDGNKKINILEKELFELKTTIDTFKSILKEPIKPNLDIKLELFSEEDNLKEQLKSINNVLSELYIKQRELEIKIKTTENSFLSKKELEIKNIPEFEPEVAKEIICLQEEYQKLESDYKRDIVHIKEQTILSNRYKLLLENKCPTCKRYWEETEDELKTVADEIQNSTNYACVIDKLIKRQEEIRKILKESAIHQKSIKDDKINKIIFKYNELLDGIKEDKIKFLQINKILEEHETRKRFIEVNLHKKARERDVQEELRKTAIRNYELTLKEYKINLAKLEKIENEYSQKSSIFGEEKDLVNLFKGYLGFIFEELLDEISTEANDLLNKIQNVSTVSVRFDTEKINQDDSVRQEIKLIISQNGNQLPSFRTLSGGQQEAVELAIDLSLGNVISRRTGIFPGWLVLDEPFSGLGVEEKESCLEMLKIAACDRLIFVVDHSTESKEYFNFFIEIDNLNGKSSLRW